nr:transcription factor VIP1-like [Tanacetum cinerariifolium]
MDFNMPEVPPNNRGTHHRRAQSETFYRFTDDDILLDDVVADFNFASIDLPPSLNTNNNGESSSKSESESCEVGNGGSRPPLSHVRSLSVDGGFFEGLGFGGGGGGGHVRSNSMDGSVTSSFDGFGGLDNIAEDVNDVAPLPFFFAWSLPWDDLDELHALHLPRPHPWYSN